MAPLKFVCIVSSVREGRLAERMIRLIKKQFDATIGKNGHSLTIIDPEVYDLPVLKQPLHFYQDQSKAPQNLRDLNEVVKAADAYIILTAEYNRSVPPALSNLMNHLPPPSFEYKPSALCGYSMGPHGGALACAAARPFLSEMGCIAIKPFTTIASAQKEVTEDGTTENTHIVSSLSKLLKELEWWGVATQNMRNTKGLPNQ